MIERLTSDQVSLPIAAGHVERYQLAAEYARPGNVVMDVACGVGYGAAFFPGTDYHGYDRPGVPDAERWSAPGGTTTFHGCDLNDWHWHPAKDADVTCCFETLEHVEDPERVAARLGLWTGGRILVSIPVVPTADSNPFHLHDIDPASVPGMFRGWTVLDTIEQPHELARVWVLAWI